MAQPVELKIILRRGISGAGETTQAEVCLSFKLGEADSDLPALVEAKFHEVKRALVRALDSEEPPEAQAGSARADGPEDLGDWIGAAPAKERAIQDAQRSEGGEARGEEIKGGEKLAADGPAEATVSALPELQVPDGVDSPACGIEAQEEFRLPITPAQKRTILSLCESAGIDGRHLQGLLENGYNRKSLDSLGRREAGSLIFRLSQRQRERMLGDRPDFGPAGSQGERPKEVHSLNGGAH